MRALGLDLGTTTISALVMDLADGRILEAVNMPNASRLEAGHAWEHCQDPGKIAASALALIDQMKGRHGPIGSIGLTGQMHGIVYLDADGRAVSPLYTWQDQRGALTGDGGKSLVAELSESTRYTLAVGYGSVTHAYNQRHGLVPAAAKTFAAIQDYIGLLLTGRQQPLVHASNAASFGLFQSAGGSFDQEAIRRIGLDTAIFPETTGESRLLGITPDDIPVAVAIGDNQASFIGSVQDPTDSILVNIGTGGQISVWSPDLVTLDKIETRPYVNREFLLVGAALCGGRAYAILEQFLRRCAAMAGYSADSLYPVMNALALQHLDLTDMPTVRTTFAGTRQDQTLRGGMDNLGIDNFTPEHLIVAFLEGMAAEMADLYREMAPGLKRQPARLIGSGNGFRLNPALRAVFSRKFGKTVEVPIHKEEAACGAALFGAVAAGLSPSLRTAQQLIRYI